MGMKFISIGGSIVAFGIGQIINDMWVNLPYSKYVIWSIGIVFLVIGLRWGRIIERNVSAIIERVDIMPLLLHRNHLYIDVCFNSRLYFNVNLSVLTGNAIIDDYSGNTLTTRNSVTINRRTTTAIQG